MMTLRHRTIAPEMIDCIAEGRRPSIDELHRVADHIWIDIQGDRSALAWGELTTENSDRRLTLNAAQAALSGAPPPR